MKCYFVCKYTKSYHIYFNTFYQINDRSCGTAHLSEYSNNFKLFIDDRKLLIWYFFGTVYHWLNGHMTNTEAWNFSKVFFVILIQKIFQVLREGVYITKREWFSNNRWSLPVRFYLFPLERRNGFDWEKLTGANKALFHKPIRFHRVKIVTGALVYCYLLGSTF